MVQVPVSDVDRAKAFYTDHFGFHLDHWAPLRRAPPAGSAGFPNHTDVSCQTWGDSAGGSCITGAWPARDACGHRSVPECRRLEASTSKGGTPLINLQQDVDGFIRMPRHFPDSVAITITFADGTAEEFSGAQLNQAHDAALAEYRAKNNLDAKGFSRAPRTKTNTGNKIEFVPVRPGMGSAQ
ncbi:MAG: VOC family protein [Arthrobacter sp.]